MKLAGRHFAPNSVVLFDGKPVETRFGGDAEISGRLTAAQTARPGNYRVTVSTPRPGGGTAETCPSSSTIRDLQETFREESKMKAWNFSRRGFMKGVGVAGAAAVGATGIGSAVAAEGAPQRDRAELGTDFPRSTSTSGASPSSGRTTRAWPCAGSSITKGIRIPPTPTTSPTRTIPPRRRCGGCSTCSASTTSRPAGTPTPSSRHAIRRRCASWPARATRSTATTGPTTSP